MNPRMGRLIGFWIEIRADLGLGLPERAIQKDASACSNWFVLPVPLWFKPRFLDLDLRVGGVY